MKGTTPERLIRKQLWVYEHLFRTPSTSRPLRFQPNGNQRNRTLMLVTTLPFNNLAVVMYKFHPSDESNPYRVRLHTIRNDESPRREIKIVNFTPRTDSVNLVVVAVDCNVGHCLPIAYSRLCQHKKTLTVQEGGRLGIETVCLLYRARQKVREIWRCKSMTLQSHSSENWSTRPSMGCSSQGRRCPSWSPRWIRHIQRRMGRKSREQRARPVRIQNMSRLRRDKARAISKVEVPEAMNTTNRGELSPENGPSFQPNLMAFRRKWTSRILDQLQWHLSD